jgi:hypothetical protein
VRLIVQVEAVIDQLVELDVLNEITAVATWARAPIAAWSSFTRSALAALTTGPSFTALTARFVAFGPATGALRTPAFTGRTTLSGRSILARRAFGLAGLGYGASRRRQRFIRHALRQLGR